MTKLRELIEATIHNIDKFEYLWYFTAAQNKDVGRATLDVLKQEVDNTDFVIRVAFECHDKGVTAPVTCAILDRRYLQLEESRSFPAYVYSLDTSSTLVSIIIQRHAERCVSFKKESIFIQTYREKKVSNNSNSFNFVTE